MDHLSRNLVLDADLSSASYLTLVRGALAGTRGIVKALRKETEYGFFTLASLMISQMAGDWPAAEKAATQLIQDEKEVHREVMAKLGQANDQFLLGRGSHSCLHYYCTDPVWTRFAHPLKNPNGHADTELVIQVVERTRFH